MQTIECKYCDAQVSYKPFANFILFCPACKRRIVLECEYGYGPVTPCRILLGENVLGTVTSNAKNKYLLQTEADGKTIKLEKSYLDALYEAEKIIKSDLSTKTKALNTASGVFSAASFPKIRIKGGSLCFYGDWFGRPYDNFHRIEQYFYEEDLLEIVFDNRERLIIFEPSGIVNTEHEFIVSSASKVKWSWFPYGKTCYSDQEMNKITYEPIDGKVRKTSKYGTEIIEKKEPYFAVSLSSFS